VPVGFYASIKVKCLAFDWEFVVGGVLHIWEISSESLGSQQLF
jgi:hypothetical protein